MSNINFYVILSFLNVIFNIFNVTGPSRHYSRNSGTMYAKYKLVHEFLEEALIGLEIAHKNAQGVPRRALF